MKYSVNNGIEETSYKKAILPLLLAVAFMLIIAVGSAVSARGGRSDVEFRFYGRSESVSSTDDTSHPFNTTSDGWIIAPHFGRGSVSGDVLADWSNYSAAFRCGEVSGTVNLIAANGDILRGIVNTSMPSVVCEAGPDELLYESTLYVDIDGANSTGRFMGATGDYVSTTMHTREALDPGPGFTDSQDVGSWEGTLTLQH